MDDVESGEKSEKETPPLQIDQKWYVRHVGLFGSLTVDRDTVEIVIMHMVIMHIFENALDSGGSIVWSV